MPKKDEAREILSLLKMPEAQRSDVCCYALLAMCGLGETSEWRQATNEWIRIHDVIRFTENAYGAPYAENSRETFRKQAMHHFRSAAIIEDNGKATNSPNYRYRVTGEALALFKEFGGGGWFSALNTFLGRHQSLVEMYASKKEMTKMPVQFDGKNLMFSTGGHNRLQKLILEEFAPRFAPSSECLYVGDTGDRDLHKDAARLESLGFSISLHDKMPDVVLYRKDEDWLYFIEAVTSVGPMDAKRIIEIEAMTEKATAGKIYVTAFPTFKAFKPFLDSIAWETEVWIADMPDHMIHMDGDMFLGPRRRKAL
jgi:hypothetical protein